ncbi:MAG: hypothetical protein IKS67_11975, partial [Victivallales bacterium]|nr:hypothetical protein [Victivallales bacterium]
HERIVLDDIWKELPAKRRFFDMTPILAILAMLCLLLSKLPIFIRKQRSAVIPPVVQRLAPQTAQAIISEKPKQATQPEETPPHPTTPSVENNMPQPKSEASISDALKRVRKR